MGAVRKKGTVSLLTQLGTVALMLCMTLSFIYPASAADDAQADLKTLTPRIDPDAEKKATPRRPLQAGLQMNHTLDAPKLKPMRANTSDSGGALKGGTNQGGLFGHLRGGAKNATQDTLKAKTNQSGFNVAATSGFGIIGVKFVLSLGKPPIINRVFPGTPAYVLGMQKDDAIVAVDGVPTYGLSKEEVYDLIIGSPGTKVNVSIMRAGDFHVYTCTRMDINDLTDPVVRRDYLMSM